MNKTSSPTQNYKYQIDIPYFDEYHGELTVEATFCYEAAYSNPDSDWESRDWLELEGYSAYKNGNLIFADIPCDILYTAMRQKMKDLTIEHTMHDNEGF